MFQFFSAKNPAIRHPAVAGYPAIRHPAVAGYPAGYPASGIFYEKHPASGKKNRSGPTLICNISGNQTVVESSLLLIFSTSDN